MKHLLVEKSDLSGAMKAVVYDACGVDRQKNRRMCTSACLWTTFVIFFFFITIHVFTFSRLV